MMYIYSLLVTQPEALSPLSSYNGQTLRSGSPLVLDGPLGPSQDVFTLEMYVFQVLLELIFAGRRRTAAEMFCIPKELVACGVSRTPGDFLSG